MVPLAVCERIPWYFVRNVLHLHFLFKTRMINVYYGLGWHCRERHLAQDRNHHRRHGDAGRGQGS